MTRLRRNALIMLSGLLSIIALIAVRGRCPTQGIAFTAETRAFFSLKNRTALPQKSDFDDRLSLFSVLQPGNDRTRWSTSRAARVEGYVVDISNCPMELANCYLPCRLDTHIILALRLDAPAREQMVLEITPPMRDWASRQGWDWSEPALRRELLGRWVYFEGWLLFDLQHEEESENTASLKAENWRATAWEIHPITYFKVIR